MTDVRYLKTSLIFYILGLEETCFYYVFFCSMDETVVVRVLVVLVEHLSTSDAPSFINEIERPRRGYVTMIH